MKKCLLKMGPGLRVFPLSALALAVSSAVYAGDEKTMVDTVAVEQEAEGGDASSVESITVRGRLRSAARDIISERMEKDVAVDIIDAKQMSRIGDSTLASALRRVVGLTLVDDKFVYVRGLGERYSSTTLNGAYVPSPDLTRNVLPLDIFSSSVASSVAVQKVYSADKHAAFGGGSIDIRTKSTPDDLLFDVELSTGTNSEDSDFLGYQGGREDTYGTDDGTRALPQILINAVQRYQGDLNPINIAETDGVDRVQAERINRALIKGLNRNLDLRQDSIKPDGGVKLNLGNRYDFGPGLSFSFLLGGQYSAKSRNKEEIANSVQRDSETGEFNRSAFKKESKRSVAMTGHANFALDLNGENRLKTTTMSLRMTDDKTSFTDVFDDSNRLSDKSSARNVGVRFEERELLVNQIHGEHELGYETLEQLNLGFLKPLEGLKLQWFYSDSESATDIPNEFNASKSANIIEPFVFETNLETFSGGSSSLDYRFTELEDFLDNGGWQLSLPVDYNDTAFTLIMGGNYMDKTRYYRQTQFGAGTNSNKAPLAGSLGSVFSDANIDNPDNGFLLERTGSNSESYIAANKVNALFGKVDMVYNDTWRLVAGARWEDYKHVGLDWDPYDFTGNQIIPDNQENYEGDGEFTVINYFRRAVYQQDDVFASLALTYMTTDFWAEDFQLRLSYGETTVRPDLREITGSSYLDPLTDFLVFGNPDLVPTTLNNYDLRAEWFFDNDDTFTVSVFYKDLENPIDQSEAAAGDNALAFRIINTESAEIRGLELEFFKTLDGLTAWSSPFFLQGNVTVLDTNTLVGEQADAPTNQERELAGASDLVNLVAGYDSLDGLHSSTLAFNWFGERVFAAGRNGEADIVEKPFQSLDWVYSYHPSDNWIIKLKLSNLLDEASELERSGVTILSKTQGQSFSVSAKYDF